MSQWSLQHEGKKRSPHLSFRQARASAWVESLAKIFRVDLVRCNNTSSGLGRTLQNLIYSWYESQYIQLYTPRLLYLSKNTFCVQRNLFHKFDAYNNGFSSDYSVSTCKLTITHCWLLYLNFLHVYLPYVFVPAFWFMS